MLLTNYSSSVEHKHYSKNHGKINNINVGLTVSTYQCLSHWPVMTAYAGSYVSVGPWDDDGWR